MAPLLPSQMWFTAVPALAAGKCVATVCHGPMCLVGVTDSAGEPYVKGKKVWWGWGGCPMSELAAGAFHPSRAHITLPTDKQ